MEALDGSIQLKAGDEPLELRELTVECTVAGGSAECTVYMVFFNPYSHKNLEGELDLPLPEDAVVCGYSLEFDGRMVPASVVEKEKARVTFEKEVRAGGATALVEHVKGNSFKVRVYPLPPMSLKRVSLTFLVDLKASDAAQLLPLPFVVAHALEKLAVSVMVHGAELEPVIAGGPPGLHFSPAKNGTHSASISLKNTSMREALCVQLSPHKERTQAYVASNDFGYHGTETFFVADDVPVYPSDGVDASRHSSLKRGGIVWDTSFSMNNVDRTRELNIIAGLFQLFDEFAVVVVRNTVEKEVVFSKKELDGLIVFLRDSVIYDGGTDLEFLSFPECDKILWFTDGISTLSGDLPSRPPLCPVYAIVSASKFSSKSLTQFCNRTGGSCFVLSSISDDESVVQEITKSNQYQLVGVSFEEGQVDCLLPSNPEPLLSGQGFNEPVYNTTEYRSFDNQEGSPIMLSKLSEKGKGNQKAASKAPMVNKASGKSPSAMPMPKKTASKPVVVKKSTSKVKTQECMAPPPPELEPCFASAPCAPPPGAGSGGGPAAPMGMGTASNMADNEPAADAPGSAHATMSLKKWLPNKPYLQPIQKLQGAQKQYLEYMEPISLGANSCEANHSDHSQSPETRSLGIRVITTLADMKLEDHRLLRIIAHKLMEEGMLEQSQWLFERVVQLRAEEPQSFRELALVHLEREHFQKAIDLLWETVIGEWPIRFQHIEDEILLQLNRVIWLAGKKEVSVNLMEIPECFRQAMPMDIHCTIAWDTDDTCIDLHIKEPTGMSCCYSHHGTDIGGYSTPDFPGCTAYSTSMLREYMIKNAIPGEYALRCNYYSNYRQDLTGGTAIWFTVYTNFCTDRETKMVTTLRLESNSTKPTKSTSYTIGTVKYGQSPFIERLAEKWESEWNAKGKKSKRQLSSEK